MRWGRPDTRSRSLNSNAPTERWPRCSRSLRPDVVLRPMGGRFCLVVVARRCAWSPCRSRSSCCRRLSTLCRRFVDTQKIIENTVFYLTIFIFYPPCRRCRRLRLRSSIGAGTCDQTSPSGRFPRSRTVHRRQCRHALSERRNNLVFGCEMLHAARRQNVDTASTMSTLTPPGWLSGA